MQRQPNRRLHSRGGWRHSCWWRTAGDLNAVAQLYCRLYYSGHPLQFWGRADIRHPGLQVLVLYSTGAIRHQVAIAALSRPTLDGSAPDGSLQVWKCCAPSLCLLYHAASTFPWTCHHARNIPPFSVPSSTSRTSPSRRFTSFN